MTLTVDCRICGNKTDLEVSAKGYMDWQMGTLIQDSLPELSSDQRELLISGTCPACWEKLFGDKDTSL